MTPTREKSQAEKPKWIVHQPAVRVHTGKIHLYACTSLGDVPVERDERIDPGDAVRALEGDFCRRCKPRHGLAATRSIGEALAPRSAPLRSFERRILEPLRGFPRREMP